jgi:hypothetical protein
VASARRASFELMSTRYATFRILVPTMLVAIGLLAPAVGVSPARGAIPRLVQADLVTSKASPAPSANAWGANGDRLVRARNGDLYTTYVTKGRDSEHFRWVLARRLAGHKRWKTVSSGFTTHQPGSPPSVLIGPSGTVFVVYISPWDSPSAGAPELWDSVTKKAEVVRGRWLTGRAIVKAGSLYPSASIDAVGDIYIWENVPCPAFRSGRGHSIRCKSVDVPGTVYWAYRRTRSKVWHSEQWVSAYRYAYDFLLTQGRNALRVVGTRDILQAPFVAPYACPNGTDYCFDQAVQARWTNLNRPPSSMIVGRTAVDAPGYTGDHRVSVEDAYLDSRGRTLALLSVSDASTLGTYENHLLVIGTNGSVTDVPYVGVPYPNLSRILEDPRGRYWIYSVGPSMVAGGRCEVFIAGVVPGSATPLGPPTVIPLARRFNCRTETRNYDVSLRSGTGRANYIDGVVATNGGADWLHYRIALPKVSGS